MARLRHNVNNHGVLNGLSDDDHPQYALLAGRASGQTLNGGTAAGDSLSLISNSAESDHGRLILGGDATDSELGFTQNQQLLIKHNGNIIATIDNTEGLNTDVPFLQGLGNAYLFTETSGTTNPIFIPHKVAKGTGLGGAQGEATLVSGSNYWGVTSGDGLYTQGDVNFDNGTMFIDSSNNNVGIGTQSPNTSAALDVNTTTGAVLLPRMTTAERDALTAANGMIIYNTTTNQIEGHENGSWVDL